MALLAEKICRQLGFMPHCEITSSECVERTEINIFIIKLYTSAD